MTKTNVVFAIAILTIAAALLSIGGFCGLLLSIKFNPDLFFDVWWIKLWLIAGVIALAGSVTTRLIKN